MSPLISVIIPSHNRSALVVQAARSVLRQTYDNLELIIVDDASTDATQDAVARLQDGRVRYLEHDRNRGASASRNTGIDAAVGDYVGFLDSDDLWLPHKLQAQVDALRRTPRPVVFGGWEWADARSGVVTKTRKPKANGRVSGQPRWGYNVIQDLLVRTDVAQKHKFDPDILSYENFDFLLRLSSKHGAFAFTRRVVVRCRTHEGERNSDQSLHRIKVMRDLIDQHESFIRSDRAAWASFNLTLGASYIQYQHDLSSARKYLYRAVRADPLKLKHWRWAMFASTPPGLLPKAIKERVFK